MQKWLAELVCGHVWGNGDQRLDTPVVGEVHFCFPCGEDRMVTDVVTTAPETVNGRPW